jgi:hypothetical protein
MHLAPPKGFHCKPVLQTRGADFAAAQAEIDEVFWSLSLAARGLVPWSEADADVAFCAASMPRHVSLQLVSSSSAARTGAGVDGEYVWILFVIGSAALTHSRPQLSKIPC